MGESYKHPDGPFTSSELVKKIDWQKANTMYDVLKRIYESFGWTAPEIFAVRYEQFVQAFNALGREMLLFDKTTAYEKALREIVELDVGPGPDPSGRKLRRIQELAQEALAKTIRTS